PTKDIVKHKQRFAAAERCEPHVDFAALGAAVVPGLARVDMVEAWRIGRDSSRDCPVFLSGSAAHRQYEMPVSVGSGGLVRLGPTEDNAIAAALDDAEIEIRVDLL